MPVVSFEKEDLESLVGKRLSNSELVELLTAMKCELESSTDNEIIVEVTSDRPDLFSAEGMSRAIRNYLGLASGYVIKKSNEAPLILTVSDSTAYIRPFIVSAAVRGVSLTSEALRQLMQLQEKLHNTYGANRRKASIGVYDLDKIAPPLVYEAKSPDQIKFMPLDCTLQMTAKEILELTQKGKEYGDIISGFSRYPLLVDSKGRVLSMPPIINSEDTKVTVDTKNLLIDVTGTEIRSINICLNIMVTAALERGGFLQNVEIKYADRSEITPNLKEMVETVSLKTINGVSGLEISVQDAENLLKRMGHEPEVVGNGIIKVRVPPYRVDIIHEVDLVEDVIMGFGLNNMPPSYPRVQTLGKRLEGSRLKSRIRDLMIGMGFIEVATYILSSREVMTSKPLLPERSLVEIAKPVSSEYAVLRDALIPKLLQFLAENAHVGYPQKIFEYGPIVRVNNGVPETANHLGVMACDDKMSFELIQAVAFSLFKNLSKEVKFEKAHSSLFIDGRSAKVIVDGSDVGILGEVHPQVLINFNIYNPAVAMEIDVSRLTYLESLFRG